MSTHKEELHAFFAEYQRRIPENCEAVYSEEFRARYAKEMQLVMPLFSAMITNLVLSGITSQVASGDFQAVDTAAKAFNYMTQLIFQAGYEIGKAEGVTLEVQPIKITETELCEFLHSPLRLDLIYKFHADDKCPECKQLARPFEGKKP